ncbi:MAG: TerB family tellurite resistance protein [Deltaproteobacteria bacterium]|nr:TerB family tellurite resistance protein [Deltaproteobacteria bacterium]
MALPLATQWTLVASGLIAHADHVLTGEECERLMGLVDEVADGDDYAQWMSIISDPEALETQLAGLPIPPQQSHRKIAETAWLMAVVDGERVDAEIAALQRIAARLSIEPMQLEFWREAWTTAQHGFAEITAAAAGWMLGGGGPVLPEDRGVIRDITHALPTTHEHREQLVDRGCVAQDGEDIERRLRALTKPQRRDLLQRLIDVISQATRSDEARERLRQLAAGSGLSTEDRARLQGL